MPQTENRDGLIRSIQEKRGPLTWLAALLLVARLAAGCREPYLPPQVSGNVNFLVVNGFLNAAGPTNIQLSRTRALNDSLPNQPEDYAQVSILGSLGEVLPLNFTGNGLYTADSLILNNQETYQLQIVTSRGVKYLSDTVAVFQTPPIDSLNWIQDSTGSSDKLGVTVYATTHDYSVPYGYYRWDYEETWRYHSVYESYFTYEYGALVPRTLQNQVYNCWKTQMSTSLVIGTTFQLSQNLIYEQPIVFIPQGAQQLSLKYSILVKQYSISQAAFEYWANLKKTTELTGSIFDPLPSQIQGNIHNVADATEPVMGFFSASSAKTRRIFITNSELVHWGYQQKGCEELVLTPDQFDLYFGSGGYIPTGQKGLSNVGATAPTCGDCTLQGGANQPPAFWP